MNTRFKYTERLKVYLGGRPPSAMSDVIGWLSTLSDSELSEFGQMVRLATRGKPIEDVVRFLAAAMPRHEATMQNPSKKILERFLISTYSNIVLERKERLQSRGRLVQKQANHRHSCPCCSTDE